MAPEGAFLRAPVHPRAYGSFARVLGHYVRDEKVLPLADAIRRMSGLPAATLGLSGRGVLREGGYADIVVFDPATVMDRATFGDPHQLSAGVSEVLVNGKVTIGSGAFTRGARRGAPSPDRGRGGERGRGYERAHGEGGCTDGWAGSGVLASADPFSGIIFTEPGRTSSARPN
ncbi:MAG: amidohydrolase family protein [Trebonia sp.]